ncbi:MAG: ATP-dependent DNA ligase [Bacteroidota bacterium]
MKRFARLVSELESTNKTNDKVAALVSYFSQATEQDKIWCLALFTGKRPRRPVKTTLMKEWALEITGIPQWLFLECYSTVGDLGETLALLLPQPSEHTEKMLYQWMQEIIALQQATDSEKKNYIMQSWQGLDVNERLIFNKLIGGSFRVGVSHKLLVNALAKYSGKEPSALMHSIMGNWSPVEASFDDLISGNHINTDLSKPYPFCLAYALEGDVSSLGSPSSWQAEYKWDGIRGQIIKRQNKVFIWSRGEELVTQQFPDLVAVAEKIPADFVIDGEILVVKDGEVQNFNDLQKRLNRKNVTPKMLREVPVSFFAYDLLEVEGQDVRHETLAKRRNLLIDIVLSGKYFPVSPAVEFSNWDELATLRENSREMNSEGLMLKRKDSAYHAGRKKGDWWKWKVDPLTIDAVMIYAQKGSGRRSAYYTDYTFAVRDGDELVTIAKAYSGLTNDEIVEINRFVRDNSVERFGPVRTVRPLLVFEIAFEGIGFSARHKSGVALRFPRILRWRRDKTVKDIDTIESVKGLIR